MQDDDLKKDLEDELGDEDIKLQAEPDDDPDSVILDEDDENALNNAIKKLKEKLKNALNEKQRYLDSWQRDKADFINAKKRDEDDKKQFLKFAEENLISELIPVLDSFQLARGNKEAWEKADKNWRVGVEYIHSQLENILSEHGLVKIDPIGKPFDPKEHHSVALIPTTKKEDDHKVLEVVSTGYSLNGKNIKPAQVKVGEFNK